MLMVVRDSLTNGRARDRLLVWISTVGVRFGTRRGGVQHLGLKGVAEAEFID
jgi:hypothetical protein